MCFGFFYGFLRCSSLFAMVLYGFSMVFKGFLFLFYACLGFYLGFGYWAKSYLLFVRPLWVYYWLEERRPLPKAPASKPKTEKKKNKKNVQKKPPKPKSKHKKNIQTQAKIIQNQNNPDTLHKHTTSPPAFRGCHAEPSDQRRPDALGGHGASSESPAWRGKKNVFLGIFVEKKGVVCMFFGVKGIYNRFWMGFWGFCLKVLFGVKKVFWIQDSPVFVFLESSVSWSQAPWSSSFQLWSLSCSFEMLLLWLGWIHHHFPRKAKPCRLPLRSPTFQRRRSSWAQSDSLPASHLQAPLCGCKGPRQFMLKLASSTFRLAPWLWFWLRLLWLITMRGPDHSQQVPPKIITKEPGDLTIPKDPQQ